MLGDKFIKIDLDLNDYLLFPDISSLKKIAVVKRDIRRWDR